ncbi:MAG: reverse transcriptase domain-containing protein [Alphaproteobacteria bacterium]
MPTRSYLFPHNFSHIEALLRSENQELSDKDFIPFREKNIAPLFTTLDLAIVLGIGPRLIFSIQKNQKNYYREFSIRKSNGTLRQINAPRTYLKVIQWWILDNILAKITLPSYIFGFSKGGSIQNNASYHLQSRHLLNVDIKSFFNSVSKRQVTKVFLDLGYSEEASSTLAKLCTLDNCLPQGAPTSPCLANLVMIEADNEIQYLSSRLGIKYSRYADDLTFSSAQYIGLDFLNHVSLIIEKYGFALNTKKTRFAGTGSRMEVTGLVAGYFIQPPIQWRKLVRARLHRLKNKEALDINDISYLLGIRGYSLQFPTAKQMQSLLNSCDELLKRSPPVFTNSKVRLI